MSAFNIGWIWQQDISPIQKLVLFALNEHTYLQEHGDWRVYPAKKTLMRLTGLSESSIHRAIKDLEEAGVIRVALQFDGDGRQRQNMYWLNAPTPMGEGVRETPPGVTETPTRVSHRQGGRVSERHPIPLIEEPTYKKQREGKKRKRFVPPSVDEVAEYVSEKGYSVDAEEFVSWYGSIGWTVGKNKIPMSCWKSSVAGWNARRKSDRQKADKSSTKARSLREDLTDRSWAG